MRVRMSYILAVVMVLAAGPAYAQQGKQPLPQVLIIGDAVYAQHARGATTDLKDRANVRLASWPQAVLPSSTNMIEHLDLLLGIKDAAGKDVAPDKQPTWDLIHFNAGLGDLIHCVPNLKSHRALPYDLGGVIRTDSKAYEKNLDTLVRLIRNKAPKAKIIWASTTPIRSSSANFFRPGSEVEYNEIAARVMKKHDVPINDMHAHALAILDMEKPAAQDPFHFDGKPLHAPIVQAIIRELTAPTGKTAEKRHVFR